MGLYSWDYLAAFLYFGKMIDIQFLDFLSYEKVGPDD